VTTLKTINCRSRKQSRVALYPTPEKPRLIARVFAGRTRCVTSSGDKARFGDGRGTSISMTDPLFGVFVQKEKTVVKVVLGFVEVTGTGGQRVILGPGQQSSVPAGGDPSSPEPIALTAEDRADFGGLRPKAPKPKLGPPDPANSRALARIFARKVLVVGVDSRVADGETRSFIENFVAFHARSWQLNFRIVNFGTEDAMRGALVGDRIDLGLSPRLADASGIDTLPLFANLDGMVWRLALLPDPTFRQALQRFVKASVESADYSEHYRSVFKRLPDYEPLRPVLFG
jgi:hypothetical protein